MNLEHFGQIMVPLEEYHTLQIDKDQFVYMQIEALGMLYNHLYLFQVCQALVCVRLWCVSESGVCQNLVCSFSSWSI